MKRTRRFKAVLLATLLAIGVAGCGGTGPVLTTPGNPISVAELFPTALLAEPIKLRAGYTHTTQPFEVTSPEAVWEVSLGVVRRDEKIPAERFFCLVDSRNSQLRKIRLCSNDEPGIHIQWELLSSDGKVVHSYTYDALKQIANNQTTRKAYQLGLGAFARQAVGQYTVKVTVLRDFPELDITGPHSQHQFSISIQQLIQRI